MSDRRYALLFESLPVGIVVQFATGEVIDANSAALSILDVRPEEIIGRSVCSLFTDARNEDGTEVSEHRFPVSHAVTTKQAVPPRLLRVLTARRTEPLWVRMTAIPELAEDGSVIEVYATLEDVTEAKRFRERLYRTEKLEAIGTLAGGIAHDFNNILTVVTGYAEMLEGRLKDDELALADVKEISRAAKSAIELTLPLRAFGRTQMLGAC